MGVEYSFTCEYGIRATKDLLKTLDLRDFELEEKIEKCKHAVYRNYGDNWSGDNIGSAILLKDKSLKDLQENICYFTKELLDLNVVINFSDIEFIAEEYVY